MPLEQEVIDWAATRLPWQRHILGRIARGDTLMDSDYEQVVEAIIGSKDVGNTRLAIADLPIAVEGDEAVRLLSIANPEHVNAIASAEPLTFASNGITIVYGDNGTGKSGYARLLKRIARARHQEEILSDVFRDTGGGEPNARIAVRIGDRERSLDGPVSLLPELRRMLFYDDECGSVYIRTESDFPYRPAALFVMDKLIEACVVVRRIIDTKLMENNAVRKTLPVVDPLVGDTEAGRSIARLSGSSSIERLDRLISTLDQVTETVERLRAQEARLIAGDTRLERQRLTRDAAKLDSLASHLEALRTVLGTDAISALKVQRDRVGSLDEAASVLARALDPEPLEGAGTQVWKELWTAARRFSESHAYPDYVFPATHTDSRCVLCHQSLSAESGRRLRRFDEFVKNDTQQKLVAARDRFKVSCDQVSNLIVCTKTVESNLLDLEASNSTLVSEIRSTLSFAVEVQSALIGAISEPGPFPRVEVECDSLVVRIREIAVQEREEARELADPEATKNRLLMTTKKRIEIELLGTIKLQRSVIVEEIKRLQLRAKLEEVKNSAATGPITRKISELSETEVTEVIRDRFTRETERLQLERVTIAKTRAERTALMHQAKLVGARQQVTLPQVFSEGEKTALGLASFFTEARLDPSKSALILDDPVSSLDHVRRELVANRLVDLSLDRQIIVFTHDVSFVVDLKREASGRGISVTDRSVARSRGGERKPGMCSVTHPWKAKDVSQRLGALREGLAKMKRNSSEWDEHYYEAMVAMWSGELSETWERIFSQEIVGPVISEGGLQVRPAMVRVLAKFSDEDNREFQTSYSRVSQWARRHDKSSKVNYVAPEVNILETELQLVDGWFRRVKAYKS